MYKIFMTAGATLLLVLFGLQNSDHVPVSLIVGTPAKIRLIFLLSIAATVGFLASYIGGLVREMKLRKVIRSLSEVDGRAGQAGKGTDG